MRPRLFTGFQRILGAPANWDAERFGSCEGLPVVRDDDAWISVWQPSWRERWAILTGADVMLEVVSAGHPPVAIRTTRSPKPQAAEPV